RVGQGCSHNAPRHALQAQLTPPQMAARALERRLRDERWWGAADLIVISDSEPDSDGVVVVIDD
ncbi:hypothetical protein IWW52_005398, partial [Coemansia sp. RSA 2704]